MYSSGDAPQLARRSAGSASGDAPQLARRSAGSASGDTSQLDASSDGTVSMFRIGSFNVGVEQNSFQCEMAATSASQPSANSSSADARDSDVGAPNSSDGRPLTRACSANQDLTRQAQRARDRLRWAENQQRKKLKGAKQFTRQEQALLEDLVGGKMHAEANDATRKSGWGRIKHPDGTFEDIAPHNGGIVRTVLDNVVVEELCEEEPHEEESPNWDK